MNYITSKKGVLLSVLPLCLLLFSCSQPERDTRQKVKTIEVQRTGGVTVDPEGDQLAEFFDGMVISDSLDMAYGVDLRIWKAYQFSLKTGVAAYLAPEGKGPNELLRPHLFTKKRENEFLIYDVGLDQVADYKDGEILTKYPGFTSKNVWTRNHIGFYYDGFIITGVVDPEKVRAMDFDNAKPLAFLNYKNGKLEKKGVFSPTVDRLDSDHKFPVVYYDEEYNTVFYLFITDHTIMAYNLQNEAVTAPAAHKPALFRTKSSPIQTNSQRSVDTAMQNGLSVSLAIGIDRVGDQLVVVWQNFNEGFYENMGDQSSGNIDYFGVLYDLPDLTNPREFALPGKFHGVYKNKLLITDNYGAEELQLSFYEFVE